MRNRDKLTALISKLGGELNGYTSFKTEDEVDKYYRSPNNQPTDPLTRERKINIINARTALIKVMVPEEKGEVKEEVKNLNDEGLDSKLGSILGILEKAKIENTRLSLKYGKKHISYQENRLAGLGAFASFWNKTWFQSRANSHLERCFELVANFKKELQKERQKEKNGATVAEMAKTKKP